MEQLGELEVLLVSAQGLKKTVGRLTKIDPYALLTCGLQVKKSKVAKGPNPEWNEKFSFDIYDGVQELAIVVMDKDTCCPDDFLGEVTINLGPVFEQYKIPPTTYKLKKINHPAGEIKLGLEYIPAN